MSLQSKVLVKAVTADEMLANWPHYRGAIQEAMSHSFRECDNLEEVMDALADWRAHLLEIVVEGESLAVAVIDTVEGKGGTWLNVWGVAGTRMSEWLPGFIDYLKAQASKLEMLGVMCGGRLGWERELARYGWKKRAVIMEIRVCH